MASLIIYLFQTGTNSMLTGIYLDLNEFTCNRCHVKGDLFKFDQICLAPVPKIGTRDTILAKMPGTSAMFRVISVQSQSRIGRPIRDWPG